MENLSLLIMVMMMVMMVVVIMVIMMMVIKKPTSESFSFTCKGHSIWILLESATLKVRENY